MGLCTKRRVFKLFLLITFLQIVTTGFRQIFDFLGPLWALILTNFFNIVFCILGFFGGYTRRKYFLVTYIVWSVKWAAWNAFILCLYIPIPQLEVYKSSVLSVGTGGFSWWETRAPGCVPDWASETRLIVTNCYFDPQVLESVQAGLQIYLALWGVVTAIVVMLRPHVDYEKDRISMKSSDSSRTVPAFLGYSGTNSMGRRSRASSRTTQRGALSVPSPSTRSKSGSQGHGATNGDPLNSTSIDDRLRPMTPRKVKRRSARSIQSQRYGPHSQQPNSHGLSNGGVGGAGAHAQYGEGAAGPGPSSSRYTANSGSNSSNRNSLRSNTSRRSTNHRNSKRKNNIAAQQFISPVNRLMQQQQLQQFDSETSHDEPRFNRRDQGHVNPVYLGPQASRNPPAPPRPPSARSSYSNYHPARLPVNSGAANPNIFNLNQNAFTNAAFDTSTEYNNSQLSSNTNGGFYEEEVDYHPMSQIQPHNQFNHHNKIPPVPMPRPNPNHNPILHPPPPPHFSDLLAHHGATTNRSRNDPSLLSPNPTLVYPLAHSPVSQDSFPMWGVAQAQVPTQSPSSSGYPALTSTNRPYQYSLSSKAQSQQPTNSETVI